MSFWFNFCRAASSKKSWCRKEKHWPVRPARERERQEPWAQLARVLGLCCLSSAKEERLGTPACPRAEAAGIKNSSDYKRRRTEAGKGGNRDPTLPASFHKDMAGGAWTQPSLSKRWQGLGASGPEYGAWITLYPYDGGLREGSRPQASGRSVPPEQKPD